MRIPFQDSRDGWCRRWTDYNRMQKIRFWEIYDLMESCNEFKETEYIKLRELIESRIRLIQKSKAMV